jgi:ribose 1,5-bisphosphokinase PhnN
MLRIWKAHGRKFAVPHPMHSTVKIGYDGVTAAFRGVGMKDLQTVIGGAFTG